jgi:LysM repeat protein
MRMTRGLSVVAVVFCAGLGLGFAWRQGWLPVEFVPPNTGVLDDAEQSLPGELEPPSPLAAELEEASSELVQFDGLAEPPPEFAPLPTPSAVVVEPAGQNAANRVTPAVATDNGPLVQPASTAAITNAAWTDSATPEEVLAEHKELSRIYWREPERRAEIQSRIDETARLIFFAPQPHFVEPHVIQPGDRLEAVAAKQKLSWEYLSRMNNVDPKRIQAGRRLKLVRGPFSAVVELADFSLTVHLQGYYVKRYSVGIGKDGSTPSGTFPVLNKVVNPQYTDPSGKVLAGDDPANPLGERWIDLGNSYGIHGTIEPESIGHAASRGCIRLRDADIVEVYDFLVVGSEIVIR